MTARIMIQLDGVERSALAKLAEQERREPREQAAWIIRQTLERLGLLPPAQEAKDAYPR